MLSPLNRSLGPLGVSRRYATGPSSLLTDLVSYWKLDETSGTRMDAHGSNHLTDNNTVTSATGKIGNAAQFTAANAERFIAPLSAELATGDIDYTVGCWVWLNDISRLQLLVTKWGTSNAEYQLFFDSSSSRFWFSVSGDGGSGAGSTHLCGTSSGAVLAGQWYLLLGWHNSTNNTINLQVHNGIVDTTAHSAGSFEGNALVAMGQYGQNENSGFYLDGRIDEVGFWKRVLTSDERTALYNSGNGVTYPF